MPRSSHDAVILGSTIYVVGGWNLQKGREGDFHNTLLSYDLAVEKPVWNVVPAPFKRRAISAAEYQGKIYVLGGMHEDSSVGTEVDIFDPQSQQWSKGPAFYGSDLDGFGTTSFTVQGRLLLVTRTGAIQRLAADGRSWEIAGQLNHPRFFARLLPLPDGGGVVIAGANMKTGKVLQTEVIK
jgi:N-acetylneuraminic acid mutarotase